MALAGTPAGRETFGACIRADNRFSVSPGPPSTGGGPAFRGIVAQPNPDTRRRRMVIASRRTFLMRNNTFIFNHV